jgi:UDP-N-acetylmuramoyl-tripeptide--D-alanyl-D-alanine ligase
LNNRIGVPSVALAIQDETYAVLELGMSVPGEIAALSRIVEADVAALLNVGVAHASSFDGSREAVAREKGAIFDGLVSPRVAVFNVDDDLASAELARCPGAARVGFGVSPHADVRLVHRDALGPFASRVTVGRGADRHDVRLPAPGDAAALDLVAAIAIADATHGAPIPWPVIEETIGSWQPAPGRSVPRTLAGDVLVLDDSYNANPASMRAALATLEDLQRGRSGRAIVVLGEMLELGDIAAREHDAVCAELAQRHVDLAVGCGGMINEAMKRAKPSRVTLHAMAGPEEAGAFLVDEVRAGDVVLFKGSRGAAVERALAVLIARRPPLAHSAPEGP